MSSWFHGRAPNLSHGSGPSRVASGAFWRHPVTKVVGLVLALVVLVLGLLQFRVDTRLDSFLPSDSSLSALNHKAESFGGDPIVVLLEADKPRSLLLDQRQFDKLFKLEGQLATVKNVSHVYGPATVLNQIAGSAQTLLAELSGRRDAIRASAEKEAELHGATKAGVVAAGNQAVQAFDLRYGRLLVEGLPAGLPTLKNPSFIDHVIFDEHGQPRSRWAFVVPTPNTVAVLVRPKAGLDQQQSIELTHRVRTLVAAADLKVRRTTVSGVPAVTADLSDEIMHEAPLLAGLAIVLLLVRFLLVPAAAGRLRRLVPLAVALIGAASAVATLGLLGIRLSLGAVVLLPLLLGIGSSFPLYLGVVPRRRLVVVTAAASAAAFAALGISPLPFVRQLGGALALGIFYTVLAGLFLVRRPAPRGEQPGTPGGTTSVSRTPGRVTAAVVGTLVTLVGAAGWVGLGHARVSADPRNLAAGLDTIHSAEHVEQVLGSSGEVNVVISGPNVLSLRALSWAKKAQDWIVEEHGDQLRPVISTPTLLGFLGKDPTASQIQAGYHLVPPYITKSVVRPDRKEALLTFGISLQSLSAQQVLLHEVAKGLPGAPVGYHVHVVGMPVVAAHAYEKVSSDRYWPSLLGILAAGLVLIVGLRRRRAGLLAMFSAAVATGWTLAALVVLGVSLTPLSLALGSITTVTACEFTVLLADAGPGRSAAARVVGWACFTSGLGYLVLTVSSLTVLREFGLVLVASVLFAYASARVITWLVRREIPDSATTRSNPRVEDVDPSGASATPLKVW